MARTYEHSSNAHDTTHGTQHDTRRQARVTGVVGLLFDQNCADAEREVARRQHLRRTVRPRGRTRRDAPLWAAVGGWDHSRTYHHSPFFG